jgi:hypothetical protein
MRLRLPKTRRYRIYLYLLSALIILFALDLLLVRLGRHITIAPDTTRITTPLRPDGTPDYLQSINTAAAAGVTPDNNAAIPLVRILGPTFFPSTIESTTLLDRNVTALAYPPGTFLPFEPWFHHRHAGATPPAPLPAPLPTTLTRPWSAAEQPELAAWLAANAEPLDEFQRLTRRPRYHFPLTITPGTELLCNARVPRIALLRDIATAANLRALERIQAGDLDAAAADIAAEHRMASLLTSGGNTTIEHLTALTIDSFASLADARLAQAPALTPDRARGLLADFDALPPLSPISRSIDLVERSSLLDFLCAAARHGTPWAIRTLADVDPWDNAQPLAWPMMFAPLRYNQALRNTNALYDQIVASADAASYRDCLALDSAVQDRIRAMHDESTLRQIVTGDLLPARLIPAFTNAMRFDRAARQRRDLARLAFALAAFHADHHAYPPALADLAPAYLPTLPTDRFTDAPLVYRTTPDGYLLYSLGPNLLDNGGRERGQGPEADDLALSTAPPRATRPR